MHVCILLNGPAGAGKDTVSSMMGKYLTELGYNVNFQKFRSPMDAVFRNFFQIPESSYRHLVEKNKDLVPNPFLQRFGYQGSMRDLFISFSEEWAKEQFSRYIFADLALMRARAATNTADFIIFSDCRFEEEVMHFKQNIGLNRCHTYQIHRPGKTYDHDSGGYVECDDIINNVDDLDFLRTTCKIKLNAVLKTRGLKYDDNVR